MSHTGRRSGFSQIASDATLLDRSHELYEGLAFCTFAKSGVDALDLITGYRGTVFGSTKLINGVKGALQINNGQGIDSANQIQHPNALQIATGELTVACLFTSFAGGGDRGDAVTRWQTGANSAATEQFDLMYITGKPKFYVSSGSASGNSGQGSVSIGDTQLHMMVGTYSTRSGLCCIYLDGVLQSSGAAGITLSTTCTQTLRLGNNASGDGAFLSQFYFAGLWKRAVPEDQIRRLGRHAQQLIWRPRFIAAAPSPSTVISGTLATIVANGLAATVDPGLTIASALATLNFDGSPASVTVAGAITVACALATISWAGRAAVVTPATNTSITPAIGVINWSGLTAVVTQTIGMLLRAPFFQTDVVPGPVTVQLRKWSGATWISDGSPVAVAQLADPNIPGSYVAVAPYTANGDGSYQGIPVWNIAAVAGWQASHSYASNALTQPVGSPNGHYYKVTAGGVGNSGSSEPTWPTNGSTVTDGVLTWTDQGQALYDGDAIMMPPIAPGVSTIVNSLRAETEWKTILANANGHYSFTPPGSYPGTGTLVLKDKSNTNTLATLTITFDSSGNPTARSSS